MLVYGLKLLEISYDMTVLNTCSRVNQYIYIYSLYLLYLPYEHL